MTDIYIATPTQADYDALMRLAEAAGYTWGSEHYPTNLNCYTNHNEQSVVKLTDNRKLLISSVERFEREGYKIETLPNLAGIKAIWNVKPEYLDVFSDEKFNTSDIIKDWALNDGVIILLENGSYDLGFEEVYKALAVEYKPQESEDIMPEKVKLPKFVCVWLDKRSLNYYPIRIVGVIYVNHLSDPVDVQDWLNGSVANQWLLIDALRYGYEAEPEQLYYVILVKDDPNTYLNVDTDDGEIMIADNSNDGGWKTQFTMDQIAKINPLLKPFAVPVEEVDGNESKNCD